MKAVFSATDRIYNRNDSWATWICLASLNLTMGKVIYIAGYGRSGSTVLDILLGNHPQITGVGEIGFLLDEYMNGSRICSCGATYRECEFWQEFFLHHPFSSEMANRVRNVEKLSSVPRLLLGLLREKDVQAYRTYQSTLLDYIRSHSQKPIVADSSKSARSTAGRCLALKKLAGQEVYVLHLIRDGLATMESLVVTGSNWALEGYTRQCKWPALKAACGWVTANLTASTLGRLLSPNHYLMFRYEDVLQDPAGALRTIGNFCGFDPTELIERIRQNDDFGVGHRVGGNRVRLQQTVKIRGNVSHYFKDLKLHHRLLFALVGGWLNYYHGYRRQQKSASSY